MCAVFYKKLLIPAVIVPSLFGDVVNVVPTTLDFGSSPIGITISNSVTLSNPTKKVLNISSITTNGDFSSPGNTCGGALSAGQQCAITVVFDPTALGARTGVLSINDDASDGSQKVKLSGNGTPAIVTSVYVAPGYTTVIKNRTEQLTASAHYSDSTIVDVTASAQWSSSAPGVATVSPTGLVTAAGPGTATIQATYNSVTGGATVNVPQPVLTGIIVSPMAVFVSPGIPQQFTALAIYDYGASTQDITSTTSWTSSNPAVCTVDSKGVALCSALGKVNISAQVQAPLYGSAILESSIQELYHGMNSERYGHTSTPLGSGAVLLAGGSSTALPAGQSTAELYDLSTGGFFPTGSMSTPRSHHTASVFPFGSKVLIAGGDASGLTTEIYDETSGTFSPASSFNVSRQRHTATDLGNGKLLIAGGYTATAELYDYSSGTFTMTGSMAQDRHDHTATDLGNTTVLITGGIAGDGTYLSSAELYDSATGAFSALPAMTTARADHTATRLEDGRVLIVGGYDGTASLSSTEIYDPVTRTFSPGPSLSVARDSHTATPLVVANTLVLLIAGGENQTGVLKSGEIYDPRSGRFGEIGNLATPNFGGYRVLHAATLIENNQILITGGYPGPFDSRISELFIPQQ